MRSRSFHALVFLGLLAVAAAYLAAQFSGRQPNTVALDVGISGIRFITLLMVVFWCQELIAREVERRTVFLALAYPVSRSFYLLGRYFGVLILAACAIAILGALLAVAAKISGGNFSQATPVNLGLGFWATMSLLFCDIAVVGAVTILIATIATTPLLPLALGFAFAIAARSLGTALAYLQDRQSSVADIAGTLGPLVSSFQWMLPDLGRLDIRAAALYDQWPAVDALIWPVVMSISYAAFALAIAVLIFRKRQFS